MAEISAAIEENLLDALRLKPVTDDDYWLENYFGAIKGKDEEKIYIELYEQSFLSFHKVFKNQPFDIFFRFNRLSFRMQHYALDFLRNHNLFNLLINNPAFDVEKWNNANSVDKGVILRWVQFRQLYAFTIIMKPMPDEIVSQLICILHMFLVEIPCSSWIRSNNQP